ncbi:hypothetical protein ACOMHN_028925 [Nucella lapillus]
MNIGSNEEMREEILSLLDRGLSTDDITLLFSRYLDQNSNHLGGDSSSSPTASTATISQSTQSLTAATLYHTHSLPRPRRHHHQQHGGVEEGNSLERFSQSEQNLVSGQTAGEREIDMRRTDSFYQAMTSSVVPRGGRVGEEGARGKGTRLHRQNSDESRTDRTHHSHRPGFIQRMLQKRKSVHEKPNSNGRPPKEDSSSSTSSTSSRKDSTRKVSIKDIFRRKNSTTSLEAKKEEEEVSSPPIATFTQDDDIGAVSYPDSPSRRRTRSSPEADPRVSGPSCGQVDASLVLRRERLPLPGEARGKTRSEFYSGEYSYCDFDQSSECRSSEDTLTPRSMSPSTTASTTTLEGGGSSSNRSSLADDFEALSRTLGAGDFSALETSMELDSTLLASPGSLDRTRVTSERTPGHSGTARLGRTSSVTVKQELDKRGIIVQGEITSSNSNDSGIQHDVIVGSRESLKIPPDIASQLTSPVKLRNSPSPKQERPKSDFTVRWADLLEQVKEADVSYRRDGVKLRRRPRPKSDLAEDSGEDDDDDEGLDYGSTSSDEGTTTPRDSRLVT